MIKFKNLTLIGSSHIAKESVKDVKTTFSEIEPEIVAIELDQSRFYLIMHPEKRKASVKNIKKIGITGFFFNLIGAYAEKKLGKLVGMTPGAEMKKAIELSKKNKTRIALIDQDIQITLKRLSKEITLKEKFRFFKDLFKTKNLKKEIKNFDLTKVPNKIIIKELTEIVKRRYPSIYKVLIKERDIILAKNLNNLITNYPNKRILAIVGAGHKESILEYLKKNEKK